MKSQLNFKTVVSGLALVVGMAGWAQAGTLPPEPSEASLINEDVNIITGLYTREYSLAGNRIVDYKTARQMLISKYNEYWKSVVEMREFPLFYWYDADQDGHFAMWVDREVKRCSCVWVVKRYSGYVQKIC